MWYPNYFKHKLIIKGLKKNQSKAYFERKREEKIGKEKKKKRKNSSISLEEFFSNWLDL